MLNEIDALTKQRDYIENRIRVLEDDLESHRFFLPIIQKELADREAGDEPEDQKIAALMKSLANTKRVADLPQTMTMENEVFTLHFARKGHEACEPKNS